MDNNKMTLLLLLICLLASCKKKDVCDGQETVLRLEQEYHNWFIGLSGEPFISFHSSNGLRQDMSTRHRQYTEKFFPRNQDLCFEERETNYLTYSATLLRNHFYISLFQHYHAPVLNISYTDFAKDHKFNLSCNLSTLANVTLLHNKATYTTDSIPNQNIEIINEMEIEGQLFSNIHKIEMTYNLQHGGSTEIVEIYLSPTHGILKYVLKNGEVWHAEF